MNSAISSAVSSALARRQSSRGTTPLPIEAQPQLNPYRLPRFWRGYVLGGLTAAGALGLYKYGKPLALPTPKPKRKSHVIQNNRHH